MGIQEKKIEFEKTLPAHIYERTRLTFMGLDDMDVYNCSIPFIWNGKEYIYGRVEKRDEWANSKVYLFEKIQPDIYRVVENQTILQLEDPFVSFIGQEIVLGGTHVRKTQGKIDTYYGYFYRGTDLNHLTYFTTGPDRMKDIRLIELANGKIGVFSRPNTEEIRKRYGSAMIGFATIETLDDLNADVIDNATPIEGIFDQGEWGGCNQVYLLTDGRLGIIGHQSFEGVMPENIRIAQGLAAAEGKLAVYVNIAFEFNPDTFEVQNKKIIATRCCYPDHPAKKPKLLDCTFPSGIVMREDGKADLYGGIGDTAEGRIVIDYPFSKPLQQPFSNRR